MQYKHYPDRPERFTKEFVEQEFAALTSRIEAAESSSTPDLWLELYADWNALKSYVGSEGSRRAHALSKDMNDETAEEADRYFREEVAPVSDNGNSALVNALVTSRHRHAVAARYGEYLLKALETAVEPLAPVNNALRVEVSDLANKYDKIVASGEVEVNGEMVTLSQARGMQSSPDRDVRRPAFLAFRQWFDDHRDELAQIYHDMVRLRHQMATNLGHENFIRLGYLGMGRTDYGPAEVESFRANVRRYLVPIVRRSHEQLAAAHGTPTLKPWDSPYDPDVSLPAGIAPVAAQLDNAQRVFDRLSPELAAHFTRMRQEGLIDLENRRGKRAGAYCTSFSDEARVAILCNSTGEEDDVRTLMHEMGHAFQGWESQPIEAVDLQWPTSDACEVHSMGMEFLSLRHMNEFFDDENTDRFRRGQWKRAIDLLCYICIVDEFQHWVYANPTATPQQRDQEWDRLWDVYLPALDFSGIEPMKSARWYAQPHIFGMPFYYIDYALAQTGAMQLGLLDAQNHTDAMERYMALCRVGGTMSVLDIFRSAGLRSPFDEELMRDLAAHAAQELKLGETVGS